MATEKPKKAEKHPSNSKGFRKSYTKGVVGWQIYLEPLRMFVNINQYASAVSADKKLIDYTLKGIAIETEHLTKKLDPPITIPSKLAGRRVMALKGSHPSFNDSNTDWSKAINMLTTLHDNKHIDKAGKVLVKAACKKAVMAASSKANLTNRLKKRIVAL